jgi:uncharacterized protein (TIGR03083 family)
MSDRQQILSTLRAEFESFGALIDGLTPEQWQTQSLCPAWTVHGVVMHVTTVEGGLLGWRPGGDSNPFAAMGAVGAELAMLSPEELAARYHSIVAARLVELDAMTDEEFDTPSFTPVGPGTYARFMAIRVFDVWVHHRDITVPLGRATDDGGPAAEMSLAEVEGSIGYIAGKKIGVPDGQGIAFEVTGPVARRILVKVDGRAARVAELPEPDATLTADTLTFMLLACGRIDPEQAIADGRVSWTGDQALGGRAARNLAFTM